MSEISTGHYHLPPAWLCHALQGGQQGRPAFARHYQRVGVTVRNNAHSSPFRCMLKLQTRHAASLAKRGNEPKPQPIGGAFCISGAHMQPTKEQVREYMQQRQAAHCPPPDQKEMNRQLGRDLVEQERKDQAGRR